MQGIATKNAPAVHLPLRFMAFGAAAFPLLHLGLALYTEPVFSGAHLQPRVVALVHLATLGWITPVMLGAYYQLIPVLLQVDLHSERLGAASFWLYAPGAALLVAGFWTWTLSAIVLGGALVVLGILLFLLNLGLTLRRVRRWNLQGTAMAAALTFLLATVIWGLVLAVNLHHGFMGGAATRHMAGHLTLGLAGWFTLSIVGVGYRLIPMFALAHGYPEGLRRPVAVGIALGALATAGAALSGARGPGLLLPVGLLFTAIALFAFDVRRILGHRRRRPELVTRFSVAAVGALVAAAALAWVSLAWPGLLPAALPAQVAVAVAGYLGLMGGISLMVVGQLYKIVPFLVWLHRYGGKMGKGPVPLLKALYHQGTALWAYRLLPTGTLATAAFALAGLPALTRLAALTALAGAGLFAFNLAQILFHLRKEGDDDGHP